MRIKLLKYLLIFSGALLLSCGNMERLDTSNLKKEIEARKIKKISEADIISFMNTHGQEVIAVLKNEDCDLALIQLDSLQALVPFELTPFDVATFETTNEKEKQVLEALQYGIEEKAVLNPTFQKLSDLAYAFYFNKLQNGCDSKKEANLWKLTFQKQELIQRM